MTMLCSLQFFIILLTSANLNNGFIMNKCCPWKKSFDKNLDCSFNKNDSDTMNQILYWDSYYNISLHNHNFPCNKFSLKLYFLDYNLDIDNFKFNTSIENMIFIENRYYNLSKAVCVDRWNILESDNSIIVQDVIIVCPCVEYGCVRKCCLPDSHIVNGICEPHDSLRDWHYSLLFRNNSTSSDQRLHQLHQVVDCQNKHRLYLTGDYEVLEDGSILSEVDGEVASDQYCGEFVMNPENKTRIASIIACVNKETDVRRWLYGLLCLVASLLLILTLVVLSVVPGEWGRAGFALFSHTCCLTVATLITALNHVDIQPERSLFCFLLGYGMQSSYLSSFCWLSVLCWLMGSSFTGVQPPRASSRRSTLGFHLACWTTTLLVTSLALLADFTTILPEDSHLRPNIGISKCWFHSRASLWLYFYGPLSVLLLVNISLFLYTSHRVATLGRERLYLHRQGSVTSQQRTKYLVYVKLFTLMGALWVAEIVGWMCEAVVASWWKWVWLLPDCVNLLRASFLLVLVLNKSRVRRHLRSAFSLRTSTTTGASATTRPE